MPADFLAQPGRVDPLLSVVVLVEPGELALLEDLLLCLDGQSCQDFELALLLNGFDQSEISGCRTLVNRFAASLAPKTTVVGNVGGNIATQLNAGVLAARGSYLVPMHADTLVFSKFLEEIARLIGCSPEAVIRVVGVEQASAQASWPKGRVGYEAVEGPKRRWALRFNALEQLVTRQSPLGTYALPMSCFSKDGLHYEEALGVGADWALFFRAALQREVVNSEDDVAVLIRRWIAEDGEPVKSDESLLTAGREVVVALFDAEPLVMPVGSASAVLEFSDVANDLRWRIHEIEQERDELLAERHDANRVIGELSAAIAERDERAEATNEASSLLDQQAKELSSARLELSALHASTSWRLTAPLRGITHLLRRIK